MLKPIATHGSFRDFAAEKFIAASRCHWTMDLTEALTFSKFFHAFVTKHLHGVDFFIQEAIHAQVCFELDGEYSGFGFFASAGIGRPFQGRQRGHGGRCSS
jgi:hypothetical protein